MLIALLFALTLDPPPAVTGAPVPAASVAETADALGVVPVALTISEAAVPQPPTPTPTPMPSVLRFPSALEAQPQQQQQPDGLRFVWRDHPSLRAGRNFRVDFSARFQLDSRDPGDEPQDFPTWEVHRLRFGVSGEIFRKLQFEVEREFTERELQNDDQLPAPTKQWKDVFIEANLANAFQFRVGRFKIPFGLDLTSGATNADFIYRSLGANYLSPSRDTGVMAHGRFFDRGLQYWIGGFEHDGDNSRSRKVVGGDLTIAGRATVRPFQAKSNAEIGGSYATTDVSDESLLPNGLRGRTVMSQFTFFEPMFVKGTRRRYGMDFDWTGGPFGARAEYTFVSDERKEQGLGDQTLNPVRARAWYVMGNWVVTGEKKNRPVEPREGGLGQQGIGAIELSARFDRMWFDSKPGQDPPFRNSRAETIYPNGDRVTTLGITYYANRFTKIQFNAIRERVEDIERSPILDGSSFWSAIFRWQIAL